MITKRKDTVHKGSSDYDYVTTSSLDWEFIVNDNNFYDEETKKVYYKDANGEILDVWEYKRYADRVVSLGSGNGIELTYDVNGNLIQKKTYSDATLLSLIETKDLTYDINGNVSNIIITNIDEVKTKEFTYDISGNLTNTTTT